MKVFEAHESGLISALHTKLSGGIMRCTMILCGLLAMGIGTAANADAAWTISAQRPCTGLTAGWAKPLAELNKLVGPNWQAAPGPVKGAGLVL
ncbi:MAG: hypothetical protein ACRESA_07385, partial [Gammaproteobacteria bacterium]